MERSRLLEPLSRLFEGLPVLVSSVGEAPLEVPLLSTLRLAYPGLNDVHKLLYEETVDAFDTFDLDMEFMPEARQATVTFLAESMFRTEYVTNALCEVIRTDIYYRYEGKKYITIPFLRSVVPLPEPLKVRIITIGHVWESPFWADLQKTIRDRLKPMRANCSGKELPVHYFDHIVKERQRLSDETGETWCFMADDGDAATDSIGLDLCYHSIAHFIPPQYLEVYGDSISYGARSNTLLYTYEDEAGDRTFTKVQQTNSQLMGDRKSFAQLTVIHMAVKLAWIRGMAEELGLSFDRLKECFHVNGDDGLILIPKRMVDRYMRFMGNLWNLNRIKTQVSTTIFSLNSRLFCDRRGVAYEVPCVRWNIINRVGRTGELMLNPVVWNELNRSLHGVASLRIWNYFHKKWKNVLDLLTSRNGNNYFVPHIAGGLGLYPSPAISYEITPQQNALIVETQKLVNVEGRMPRWATRVVPTYKSAFFQEEATRYGWGSAGLRQTAWAEHTCESAYSTSGGVKRVTKSTKLVTRPVPKERRVYETRSYENLWYVDYGPLVINHTGGQGLRLRSYY